jgi:hypothetical protein
MADICENIRPAHQPVPGLGRCIRPSQHPWKHRDSFGQAWGDEVEQCGVIPQPSAGNPPSDPHDIRGCLFAGPGRGDCEHFVGLPSLLTDENTDGYGRPNGWCTPCWQAEQLSTLEARIRAQESEIKATGVLGQSLFDINNRLHEQVRELEGRIGSLLCSVHKHRKLPKCAVCWADETGQRVTVEQLHRRGAVQALLRIHGRVQDLTELLAQILADAGPLLKGTRLATEQAQTTSDTVGG